MPPRLDEIEATVIRLKDRLGRSSNPEIARLLAAYEAVDRRFIVDLDDRRDLALSRGAAPMLVRQLSGE